MRELRVTGDDFGASKSVNRAIVEAHARGILTSSSLMVEGEAAAEAIAIARSLPTLAVGLHLVLVDGHSSLPPGEIPALVDAAGRFRRNPFAAGLLYQFSGEARRQVRREIRAQLERFRATGLALSHVDGHHHMHLHPVALDALVELAPEFGIRRIRLPSEELRFALAAGRSGAAGKIFWSLVFGGLRRSGARRLRSAGIDFSERVYGLLQTGRIDEDYLLDLIPRIQADRVEIYSHPAAPDGTSDAAAAQGSRELAALVSPRVRDAVARNRFVLAKTEIPNLLGRFAGPIPS